MLEYLQIVSCQWTTFEMQFLLYHRKCMLLWLRMYFLQSLIIINVKLGFFNFLKDVLIILFSSVDHITIPSHGGKGVLRRVSEVFDCWFESGSMPYAQVHYPFENRREFEDSFPADFIAEGIDQTRGW